MPKSKDKLLVLVDDREPESAALRLEQYGLNAQVARMEAGDYAFYPHGMRFLIERKTISDLLGSIRSGRLQSQLHKILAASDRAFLLREGAFRRSYGGKVEYYNPKHPERDADGWVTSGWDWHAWTGLMADIQMMGVDFIDCYVLGEYPQELAQFITNVSADNHAWVRERTRPDTVYLDKQYNNGVWAWSAYGGIGPESASAMLKAYGSSAALMDAIVNHPEEVAEVKANGRKLGKRIGTLRNEVTKSWKV